MKTSTGVEANYSRELANFKREFTNPERKLPEFKRQYPVSKPILPGFDKLYPGSRRNEFTILRLRTEHAILVGRC